VKKSHRWAVLAAVVLSLSYLISLAVAQGPARSAAGPTIALLDVSYIFKNHARFKGMMEDMKADVERAEAHVKSERETINKLVERLQEFRKGTPDYKQMEEDLAKRQADLAVRVNLQKGDFLQREAKIYHNVYQEIWQAADYYTKQNGIDMVLRFNGDPVDVERPDSVLTWINKPVVCYQKQLDITPAILQELNRTAVNPGPAAVPARQGVPFNNVR
jgi:Skp family chaperone for outer membrane proteins